MNQVRRRGPDSLMSDLVLGALPEPLAIVAAAHADLSPASDRRRRAAAGAAGRALDALPDAVMADGALERCLGRLSGRDPAPAIAVGDEDLPEGVRALAPDGVAALPWSWRGSARIAKVARDVDGFDLRFLAIKAGAAMPAHRHDGVEATLVLRGAYRDGAARFGRGDLAMCAGAEAHAPIAEPGETCLCLVASSGALVLEGPMGRMLGKALW